MGVFLRRPFGDTYLRIPVYYTVFFSFAQERKKFNFLLQTQLLFSYGFDYIGINWMPSSACHAGVCDAENLFSALLRH